MYGRVLLDNLMTTVLIWSSLVIKICECTSGFYEDKQFGGLIVGIVIGSIVGFFVIIITVAICIKHCKYKTPRSNTVRPQRGRRNHPQGASFQPPPPYLPVDPAGRPPEYREVEANQAVNRNNFLHIYLQLYYGIPSITSPPPAYQ